MIGKSQGNVGIHCYYSERTGSSHNFHHMLTDVIIAVIIIFMGIMGYYDMNPNFPRCNGNWPGSSKIDAPVSFPYFGRFYFCLDILWNIGLKYRPYIWLVVTGTWLLFFHILGISSSQLTNSYFSEGFVQPPTRSLYHRYSIDIIMIIHRLSIDYHINHQINHH